MDQQCCYGRMFHGICHRKDDKASHITPPCPEITYTIPTRKPHLRSQRSRTSPFSLKRCDSTRPAPAFFIANLTPAPFCAVQNPPTSSLSCESVAQPLQDEIFLTSQRSPLSHSARQDVFLPLPLLQISNRIIQTPPVATKTKREPESEREADRHAVYIPGLNQPFNQR